MASSPESINQEFRDSTPGSIYLIIIPGTNQSTARKLVLGILLLQHYSLNCIDIANCVTCIFVLNVKTLLYIHLKKALHLSIFDILLPIQLTIQGRLN